MATEVGCQVQTQLDSKECNHRSRLSSPWNLNSDTFEAEGKIVETLHVDHTSISKMEAVASDDFWWPGQV